MLRKIAVFSGLLYYVSLTVCLPAGNFSVLPDLPIMYSHCKSTEHHDMTPIEFITDHLVNFDGIFDKHNDGDEQKPHKSKSLLHTHQSTLFITSFTTLLSEQFINTNSITIGYKNKFLPIDYSPVIFHPPIV